MTTAITRLKATAKAAKIKQTAAATKKMSDEQVADWLRANGKYDIAQEWLEILDREEDETKFVKIANAWFKANKVKLKAVDCKEKLGIFTWTMEVPPPVKLPEHAIIQADHRSMDDFLDSMNAALKKFGLQCVPHPAFADSDEYGFIVSKEKFTKEQLEAIKNRDSF
jgi:hypothetical protein